MWVLYTPFLSHSPLLNVGLLHQELNLGPLKQQPELLPTTCAIHYATSQYNLLSTTSSKARDACTPRIQKHRVERKSHLSHSN